MHTISFAALSHAYEQVYSVCIFSCSELLKSFYSPKEYAEESRLLVAGSSQEQLSRANKRGITPLMSAVAYGADASIVRVLVVTRHELGEGVAQEIGTGNTAAHYAAFADRSDALDAMFSEPTVSERLFVHAFNKITQPQAETAIEKAAIRWDEWVARLVNTRNALGETPLFIACKSSNSNAARRLLHYGADPRIQVLP